jgi:3-oxoadipate enol-lactonase
MARGGYRRPVPHAHVNGAQLWYEERGTGDPVVFLHAGLLDSRQWARQLDTFSPTYRAIALDARGYGRSSRPTQPYRRHEDVLGLLDALGIDRAAIVGNSVGGKAAVDAALAQPGRVRALVAVGAAISGFSFAGYTDEQAARAEAAWVAGDVRGAADVWLEVWAPVSTDDELRRIAYENAEVDNDELELDGDPPAAGRLGELDVPTLVVVGDREVQGIVDTCRKIAADVEGARLELLPGADHLPNRAQPAAFDRLVLEFLAQT